eukprot:gene30213-35200_t
MHELFSGKYMSISMSIRKPYVVFFISQRYEDGMWNGDRIIHYDLQVWQPPVVEEMPDTKEVEEVVQPVVPEDFALDVDEMDDILDEMFEDVVVPPANLWLSIGGRCGAW